MRLILYTIVNSKVMNGGMPGSRYTANVEPYQIILYIIDGVCGAVIVLMVLFTILRFRKQRNKVEE